MRRRRALGVTAVATFARELAQATERTRAIGYRSTAALPGIRVPEGIPLRATRVIG